MFKMWKVDGVAVLRRSVGKIYSPRRIGNSRALQSVSFVADPGETKVNNVFLY